MEGRDGWGQLQQEMVGEEVGNEEELEHGS